MTKKDYNRRISFKELEKRAEKLGLFLEITNRGYYRLFGDREPYFSDTLKGILRVIRKKEQEIIKGV